MMKQHSRFFIPLLVCFAHLLAAFSAASQNSPTWHSYTSINGLQESYSRAISIGPSGKVWINHGNVGQMTVLDGHSSRLMPTPGPFLKVKEGPTGELWAYTSRFESVPLQLSGVQYYSEPQRQWIRFTLPLLQNAGLSDSRNFEPLEAGHVLLLLPDRLLVFSATTRQTFDWQSPSALGRLWCLEKGRDGNYWVGGEHGLAQFTPKSPGTWQLFLFDRRDGLEKLIRISDSRPGELCVTAQDSVTKRAVLASWQESRWHVLFRAQTDQEDVWGWPAAEGGFWLVRNPPGNFHLFHLTETGTTEPVARSRVLSGMLFDFALDQDGSFWTATSFGVAHYTPSLWWPVPSQAGLDQQVRAIDEDNTGRIFFLLMDRLVILEKERWKSIPFPRGITLTDSPLGQGLIHLPDDRILFQTTSGPMVFYPVTQHFGLLNHPAGAFLVLISKRKEGGAWLGFPDEQSQYQIITYDGKTFQPRFSIQPKEMDVPRAVLETSRGDIWVAGHGGVGIGVWHQGHFRTFGPSEAFSWFGGRALLERPDGNIWLGETNGVVQYDGHGWTRILEGTETVRFITTTQDGSVWVAAGAGLFRFHQGSWMEAGIPEGMPDGALLAVFEDSRRRIWVASTQGVRLFHPETDRTPPHTYFLADKNLKEAPPGGNVSILFSGTDQWLQTPEERLLFSHRLDGGGWSAFHPERVVSLQKLSAGKHLFEVRAMDRNWNVDPHPAQFKFKVLLPWYREPLFLILAMAGLLSLGLLLRSHLKHHFQLGRLVDERTAELREDMAKLEKTTREKERLEEQIRQSQKMESIGRLAGGVAHDFNNHLMVINGYCELLQGDLPPDNPLQEMLQEIHKAGKGAADLVRQLLAFSRKQVMEPKPILLNDVIQEMEKMLRRLIGENIELVTRLAQDLHPVMADPGQMSQVLINLVVNARDAMLEGGRITIETSNIFLDESYSTIHPDAKPGRHTLLTVADTGTGMDSETLNLIFEPFFTTKKKGGGTGLGLATTYGIIRQSGGWIWVYSEPGKGSTFKIHLPQIDEHAKPIQLPPLKLEALRGDETILLVEDQAEVRKFAAIALSNYGYSVLEASNGSEAIRINDEYQKPIHLLITDVIMPGITGRELAERLTSSRPAIRVLYISGYTANVIAHQGILDPGISFLPKPFSPDTLAAKVRDVLEE
jgi:signal transduction histidine kinase/CheY-like chemotaxis protein